MLQSISTSTLTLLIVIFFCVQVNVRVERAEGDVLRIERESEAEGIAQEQVEIMRNTS